MVMESETRATACGYSPYQEVQCDVRAYNDAGDSQTASPPKIRINCAGNSTVNQRLLNQAVAIRLVSHQQTALPKTDNIN